MNGRDEAKSREAIRAANQWHAYMRGWKHSAGGHAQDELHSKHENSEIREAYREGYADAKEAKRNAARYATRLYGHEPSILRVQTADRGTLPPEGP